jgi:PleD family two-component response regulator
LVKKADNIVVYFADKNAEFRKRVKDNLKNSGIKMKLFSFDSEDKLMDALAQSLLPDIIFLTFNSENDLALKCLKNIRDQKKFGEIPVVVFSPFTYLKDIKEALENGAGLFIPQPIFLANSQKTFHAIFKPNWRKELIDPNREKFVLRAYDKNADKLILSSS